MSFIDYLRETRGELKHVSWPSRDQTIVFTVIVVLLSLAVGYALGLFDYLLKFGLEKILIR